MRFDLAVVGGGPAGASTAITAARAGLDVVMVEGSHLGRDKTCGDGLTHAALTWLDRLGLETDGLDSFTEVSCTVMHAPDGREVVLEHPEGRLVAATACRRELDAALVRLARSAGAQVLEGARCTGAYQEDDGVTIRLRDGTHIRARYLVGADGVWSTTRKALGCWPSGWRGNLHAARQYRRLDRTRADGTVHVWFVEDLLPGYAWAFPVGGGFNTGFGIERSNPLSRESMHRTWQQLCTRRDLATVFEPTVPAEPLRSWPIPAALGVLTPAEGRALWVGDAVAAVDPLTGEGIAQALQTGWSAARAVAEAGPAAAERAREHYRRWLERELTPDMKLAGLVSHRVVRHPRRLEAALRVIALSGWNRRRFAEWVWECYPRATVFTPYRWPSIARAGLTRQHFRDTAGSTSTGADPSARDQPRGRSSKGTPLYGSGSRGRPRMRSPI